MLCFSHDSMFFLKCLAKVATVNDATQGDGGGRWGRGAVLFTRTRPAFAVDYGTGHLTRYLFLYSVCFVVRTGCRQRTIRTCSTATWSIADRTQSRSLSSCLHVFSSIAHRSSSIVAITKTTSWISGEVNYSARPAWRARRRVISILLMLFSFFFTFFLII